MIHHKMWGFAGFIRSTAALSAAWISAAAWAFPLQVAEAPSTTLKLTVDAIRSAKHSVLLNIYEFSSSDISDAILERVRAGVHVEILEEGQPVGGMSAAARGIQAQIAQAMRYAKNDNHFYEMTSRIGAVSGGSKDRTDGADQQGQDEQEDPKGQVGGNGSAQGETRVKRRFRFDHGKYAVIDGTRLLIGSENYSPTGHPQAKTKGNRGWEVLIHDRTIAQEYERIFRSDSDPRAGDLVDLVAQDMLLLWATPSLPGAEFLAAPGTSVVQEPVVAPFAPWPKPTLLDASDAVRVTSPDNSLPQLVQLIRSARKTLDIEQMTFSSVWGKEKEASPLYKEVIDAARRGVRVRVLLNDESVFSHPGRQSSSKNLPTIEGLNELATAETLPLEARTANLKRMGVTYIHNKGALVDGEKTLVSSINWDGNSVLKNREAAVILTSPAVHDHYATLFESDWKLSAPEQGVQTAICPERLRVMVAVGEIHPSDPDDRSFDSLSHSRIRSDFVRTPGSHNCLLTDTRAAAQAGMRRYIQIRKRPDGNRNAVLEGYTSNGKLYSIRTILGPEGPYDGDYDAVVYDGSGPSRERLGDAAMVLETRVQ